ncbi:MAG: hypothetical protein U0946_05765 [Patescibacteria group bacterium]|nr:hypothetical protein [Patescibacteria group bacterium]
MGKEGTICQRKLKDIKGIISAVNGNIPEETLISTIEEILNDIQFHWPTGSDPVGVIYYLDGQERDSFYLSKLRSEFFEVGGEV